VLLLLLIRVSLLAYTAATGCARETVTVAVKQSKPHTTSSLLAIVVQRKLMSTAGEDRWQHKSLLEAIVEENNNTNSYFILHSS